MAWGLGRRGRRHRARRVVAGGRASGRRCAASAAVGSNGGRRDTAHRGARDRRRRTRQPDALADSHRADRVDPEKQLSSAEGFASYGVTFGRAFDRARRLGGPAQRASAPQAEPSRIRRRASRSFVISLVDEDGKLLAEARVSLVIQQQAPSPVPPAPAAVEEKERVPHPSPRAQAPALTPAERENCRKAGRARRTRSGAGQHRAGAAILPARRANRAGARRAHAGGHL